MFVLTDTAREHLSSLLAEIGADGDMALRITVEGFSLSLQPDSPGEGDMVYSHGDRPLVVVDGDVLSTFLEGKTLDIEEIDGNKRITLS